MPKGLTTMRVGRYSFEYDFDTRELRLSWAGEQALLDPDETAALGDFLYEVLSAQGQPPRIQPLGEIISVAITHSGVCAECERSVTALNEAGVCEGCVRQAMIES